MLENIEKKESPKEEFLSSRFFCGDRLASLDSNDPGIKMMFRVLGGYIVRMRGYPANIRKDVYASRVAKTGNEQSLTMEILDDSNSGNGNVLQSFELDDELEYVGGNRYLLKAKRETYINERGMDAYRPGSNLAVILLPSELKVGEKRDLLRVESQVPKNKNQFTVQIQKGNDINSAYLSFAENSYQTWGGD